METLGSPTALKARLIADSVRLVTAAWAAAAFGILMETLTLMMPLLRLLTD